MSKKDNKKKTVYYDDGRTIADMSDLYPSRRASRPSISTWKERARTYFESVKLMILPMLLVLALISVAFLLLYVLFSFAA